MKAVDFPQNAGFSTIKAAERNGTETAYCQSPQTALPYRVQKIVNDKNLHGGKNG
jgi:hypothetical protein